MDPRERARSVWYRVAGLLRRKDLAIEIIEAEIRSAQHEVLLEAAKLVLPASQSRSPASFAIGPSGPSGRSSRRLLGSLFSSPSRAACLLFMSLRRTIRRAPGLVPRVVTGGDAFVLLKAD